MVLKIKCPVCNIEGFLEVRGSNARIKHYLGFESGKRKYEYHTVTLENLIPRDSQKTAGINAADLSRETAKEVQGVGFEPTNLYRIGS